MNIRLALDTPATLGEKKGLIVRRIYIYILCVYHKYMDVGVRDYILLRKARGVMNNSRYGTGAYIKKNMDGISSICMYKEWQNGVAVVEGCTTVS